MQIKKNSQKKKRVSQVEPFAHAKKKKKKKERILVGLT